jgi:putative permease
VLQDESPRLKSGILGLITDLETHLITRWKVADPRLAEKARALILNQSHTLSNSALKFISASFTVSFLTPLIAYFMLVDGRKTVRLLLSLVPNSLFELFLNLFHQINHQMGGFVRARLLESLMVGGCVGVGLFVFNFPYAFILALIAAATNLIPYVGPFIGAIPAVLVIFLSKKVPEFNPHGMIFFVVGGTYLLAQLIDMFLIIPLVVARIVNLHPLLVILSIIIGAEALGVLGMIISIPIASALKLIGTSVYQHLVHFRT